MKEREDRWGHVDPGFTQMENFRGQDDPGQWTPRAEAEEKENASFFSSEDLMWVLEGKIAYAPFSFISSTEFSGFDQQLLQARHFPVVYVIPIPHNCPVREGYNIPILEMRKMEIREVDLHNITWFMCGWRTQNETPVLSGPCFLHYIILPALYNRKLLTSVKTSMSLVIRGKDKEIRGTVDPWTTRVWAAWVPLYVDL